MNFSITYRPLTFNDVVGHEKVIREFLKRAKDRNFPNVILLSGKTGTGKTTIARIIGKTLVCLNYDENGLPCNKCELCIAIQNELMNNYYFEYNGSNIGIDEMRLIESLALSKPLTQAKAKVIVIDELQELSSNKKAQKNILKILERPLKNTYFILTTMDETKVDKAILNRAVKYRLNNLSEKEIGSYLLKICQQEGIDLSDKNKINTIVSIVQNCDGSVRTAVSILERVIFSEIWNIEDLQKELGIVTQDKIIQIINKLLLGDISVLENEINSDVIEKINFNLLLYYKVLSGLEIEPWKINSISGIGNFNIEKVKYAITKLLDLLNYNYVNQYLIDFMLVDIVNYCKNINDEPVKRRRLQS